MASFFTVNCACLQGMFSVSVLGRVKLVLVETEETYPEPLIGGHWGSLDSSSRDLVILVNLVENNKVGKLGKLQRIINTCLPSPDSSKSLSDNSIEEPESSCQSAIVWII